MGSGTRLSRRSRGRRLWCFRARPAGFSAASGGRTQVDHVRHRIPDGPICPTSEQIARAFYNLLDSWMADGSPQQLSSASLPPTQLADMARRSHTCTDLRDLVKFGSLAVTLRRSCCACSRHGSMLGRVVDRCGSIFTCLGPLGMEGRYVGAQHVCRTSERSCGKAPNGLRQRSRAVSSRARGRPSGERSPNRALSTRKDMFSAHSSQPSSSTSALGVFLGR